MSIYSIINQVYLFRDHSNLAIVEFSAPTMPSAGASAVVVMVVWT